MAYTLSVEKLKKQAEHLRKKEEQTRNKLRTALLTIQRLKQAYIKKLNHNEQLMHHKMIEMKASIYNKMAADLKHKVQKSIGAKEKELASMIEKVDKKHLSKLTESIAKQGKKITQRKKTIKKTPSLSVGLVKKHSPERKKKKTAKAK